MLNANWLTNRQPTKLPMVITDTSIRPLEKVSMDIVGPLPLTIEGNKYILSIQDNLTKFLWLYPLPVHTAEIVTQGLLHFFSTFGIPDMILSDQGTEFRSQLIQELHDKFGIQHILCSPYHPESNGALERTHGSIKEYLKYYINSTKDDWDIYVTTASFAFNNAVHSSTHYTPFELMFGRKVALDTHRLTYDEYLHNLLIKFEQLHRKTRENLLHRKSKDKERYDKTHVSDFHFYPGGFATLRDMGSSLAKKLSAPHKGPYKILRINFPNVTLEVKGHEKTYHANLLKPYFHG